MRRLWLFAKMMWIHWRLGVTEMWRDAWALLETLETRSKSRKETTMTDEQVTSGHEKCEECGGIIPHGRTMKDSHPYCYHTRIVRQKDGGIAELERRLFNIEQWAQDMESSRDGLQRQVEQLRQRAEKAEKRAEDAEQRLADAESPDSWSGPRTEVQVSGDHITGMSYQFFLPQPAATRMIELKEQVEQLNRREGELLHTLTEVYGWKPNCDEGPVDVLDRALDDRDRLQRENEQLRGVRDAWKRHAEEQASAESVLENVRCALGQERLDEAEGNVELAVYRVVQSSELACEQSINEFERAEKAESDHDAAREVVEAAEAINRYAGPVWKIDRFVGFRVSEAMMKQLADALYAYRHARTGSESGGQQSDAAEQPQPEAAPTLPRYFKGGLAEGVLWADEQGRVWSVLPYSELLWKGSGTSHDLKRLQTDFEEITEQEARQRLGWDEPCRSQSAESDPQATSSVTGDRQAEPNPPHNEPDSPHNEPDSPHNETDSPHKPTPPEGPFCDSEGNRYRLKYREPRVPQMGDYWLPTFGDNNLSSPSCRIRRHDVWHTSEHPSIHYLQRGGIKRWIVEPDTADDEPVACPWCKSDADVTESITEVVHFVECQNWAGCAAAGPERTTRAEAIAAWNRVARPAGERAAGGGA